MSVQGEPIHQPANDLISFDISKRSPEQIALLFARWKEQRKRLQRTPASTPKSAKPRIMPTIIGGSADAEAPVPEAVAPPKAEPGPVQYSTDFAAILAARRDKPDLQRMRDLRPEPTGIGPRLRAKRRSKTRWVLAGATSAIAIIAVSAGALWQQAMPSRVAAAPVPSEVSAAAAQSAGANTAEAEPSAGIAPEHPLKIHPAARFIPVATLPAAARPWPLQPALDAALTKPALPVADVAQSSLVPKLKPRLSKVQTASRTSAAPKPAPIVEPAPRPVVAASKPVLPAQDIVPHSTAVAPQSIGPATASVSAAVPPETEDAPRAETRPAIVSRHGNDRESYAFGSGGRVASSGSKAPGHTGSGGPANPGSGGSGTGGAGDPGSGTGGSGDGGGSGTGGDTGGSGDSGGDGSGGGDFGGGGSGGGDSGDGDSGGGDSGGGDSGGGDSGGGDAGGGDSGDGDSGGGDSGSGDAGGGESGDGGSAPDSGAGLGGVIGGALGGGIGDALGGGNGDGAGNGNGNGKDKDKSD